MLYSKSQVKILNLSPHDEHCGIGKYQEFFVQSLNSQELAYATFFQTSPNILKSQPEAEKQASLGAIERTLQEYDLLHIQHEFTFFSGDDFERFVNLAHNIGKKVVITMHTPPSLVWSYPTPPRITGLSTYLANRSAKEQVKSFNKSFVNPLVAADLIICHNHLIAAELVSLGVSSEAIKYLPLPIPCVTKSSSKSEIIGTHLRQSDDDVILAVVGFIAETKGIHHAIDALSFLPSNFKLAVVGGLHPNHGHKSDYLAQLLERVIERGLQSRFYLTGYIEDDLELIQAVSECDICLFPYDLWFYRAATSASINIATASHKPAIAFPTPAFEEIRLYNKSVQVCKSSNGYELAREVKSMNIEEKRKDAIKYSQENSYNVIAARLAKLYWELAFMVD